MDKNRIQIKRNLDSHRIQINFGGSIAVLRLIDGSRPDVESLIIDGVVIDQDDFGKAWIEWCMWLVLGDEPTGFHYYSAEYLASRTGNPDIPKPARAFVIAVLVHALEDDMFFVGLKSNALQSLSILADRWKNLRKVVHSSIETFFRKCIATDYDTGIEDLLAECSRAYIETATDKSRKHVLADIARAATTAPPVIDGIFRAFELGELSAGEKLLELSTGTGTAAARAAPFLPKAYALISDTNERGRFESVMLDSIVKSENIVVIGAAFDLVRSAENAVTTAAAFEGILERLCDANCDQPIAEALLKGWGMIGLDRLEVSTVDPGEGDPNSKLPELARALNGHSISTPAEHLLWALEELGECLSKNSSRFRVETVAATIATIVDVAQRIDGSRFLIESRGSLLDEGRTARWVCDELERTPSRLEDVCGALAGVSLGSLPCREMSRLLQLVLKGCEDDSPETRQKALTMLERQLRVDAPYGNIQAEGALRLTDPNLIQDSLDALEVIEGKLSDWVHDLAMGRQHAGPGRKMREVLPWQRDIAEASDLLHRCEQTLINSCKDPNKEVTSLAVGLVAERETCLLVRDWRAPELLLPFEPLLQKENDQIELDSSLDAVLQQWDRVPDGVQHATNKVLDIFQERLAVGATAAKMRLEGFVNTLLLGIGPDNPGDKRSFCLQHLIDLTPAGEIPDELRFIVLRGIARCQVLESERSLTLIATKGVKLILDGLGKPMQSGSPNTPAHPDPHGVAPLVDALLSLFQDVGNADDMWPDAIASLLRLIKHGSIPMSRMRPLLDVLRVVLIDSDGDEVIKKAVLLVENIASDEDMPGALRDQVASVLLEAAATPNPDKLKAVLYPLGSMEVSASWRSKAVQELNILREAATKDNVRDAIDSVLKLRKGPLTELVFISYARQDQAFTMELSFALQHEGIFTWRDMDDIPKGSDWDAAINKAAITCKRMIVIITKNSSASDWVINEWNQAMKAGAKVFPVIIEECEVPEPLAKLQYTHFIGQTRPERESLLQLVRDLSRAR